MRNLKKFLALVLAMLMVVSASATVSAFADVAENDDFAAAIEQLVELGITQGTDKGDEEDPTDDIFGIDENVTRLQAAIFFARALTGEVDPTNEAWNQGLPQFQDVTEFQYAVTFAVKAGIINGMYMPEYDAVVFNPKGNITYIQALKMAVCALGYGEGLEWGVDGVAYYNVADTLGLTADLEYITAADKALTRGEFAQLLYNMINNDYDADGITIKTEVFDPKEEIVIPDEMSTYVITATTKQTAYKNMEVTEKVNGVEMVGLQALVNGVPTGSMIYVPATDMPFAEGKTADDYFLYAFDLVNYDAETGYERIDLRTTEDYVDYIFNNEISGTTTKYNRFTFEKENYYVVESLTGDPIKNEVVLYSTTNYTANAGKELYVNANNQVLSKVDGLPVLEKVTSVLTGDVRYRVLRDDVTVGNTTYNKGDYLTYTEALAAFGVQVADFELPYAVMDASALKGYYVLTAFDDDMDGNMDRAYFQNVYMSKVTKEVWDTAGAPWQTEKKADYVAVSFEKEDGTAETVKENDVIKYSFNTELNTVTVYHKVNTTEVTGVIASINTENLYSDGYATITLEDGTVLTIYDTDDKYGKKCFDTDDFEKLYNATITGFGTPADAYAKVGEFEVGQKIKYIADSHGDVKNLVYSIKPVDATDKWATFDTLVLKEIYDTDFEAIYMEVYGMDGKVKDIAVTTLYLNGKEVELAELSWIKVAKLLEDYLYADHTGEVVKALKLGATEDGLEIYELGVTLTDAAAADVAAADKANYESFKLKDTATVGNVLEIVNNIASREIVKSKRLVVDDKTAWFFIDTKTDNNKTVTTVKVFSGDIEYAKITGGEIYADKEGYSNVATRVYVFNATVEGFGALVDADSIVYMTGIESTKTQDYYVTGSAAQFGLDTTVYKAATYYKYNAKYALDMYDGSYDHTIYSAFKLADGAFYEVEEIAADKYMVLGTDAYATVSTDDYGNIALAGTSTDKLTVVTLDAGTIDATSKDRIVKDIYYLDADLIEIKAGNTMILDRTWDIDTIKSLAAGSADVSKIVSATYADSSKLTGKFQAVVLTTPVIAPSYVDVKDYNEGAQNYTDVDGIYVMVKFAAATEVAPADTWTVKFENVLVNSIAAKFEWKEYPMVNGLVVPTSKSSEGTIAKDETISGLRDLKVTAVDATRFVVTMDAATKTITVKDNNYKAADEVAINAKYQSGQSDFAAIAKFSVLKAGEVTGTVTAYRQDFAAADGYNGVIDVNNTVAFDLSHWTEDEAKIKEFEIRTLLADGTVDLSADGLVYNQDSGEVDIAVEKVENATSYKFSFKSYTNATPFNKMNLADGNYTSRIVLENDVVFFVFFTIG